MTLGLANLHFYVQQCDAPRFAKSWPAIRDFGPFRSGGSGSAEPNAAPSSSQAVDATEQNLLADATETFCSQGKPMTGIGDNQLYLHLYAAVLV